jgi:hypothetical protein
MRQRISRKKAAVAVLAPAAVGVAAVGFGAQAAYADRSGTTNFTFVDSGGVSHTCGIDAELSTTSSGSPDTLFASTNVITGDSVCYRGVAQVRATYKAKTDGTQVTNLSEGQGGFVGQQDANVNTGAKITTVHHVTFFACDPNMSANGCTSPDFTLSQGK